MTWACLAGGLLLLAAFVRFELRHPSPLIEVGILSHRGFAAGNVVMGLAYASFLTLFFFGGTGPSHGRFVCPARPLVAR